MTLHLVRTAPPAEGAPHWRRRVRDLAPHAPGWVRELVASTLANSRATSDTVLLLAEAVEEALRVAEAEGDAALAMDLLRLANLARDQAPVLAALNR